MTARAAMQAMHAKARADRAPLPRPAHGPLGISVPETDDLDAVAWTGPVVRLVDLPNPARVALGDRTLHRPTSVHLTWRCVNEFCRQWTMDGAHLWGRCNFCNTRRITS